MTLDAATVASCVDGKPFDEVTLRERIELLAASELGGRAPGSSGDLTARTLIAEQFRCLGLTPAGDGDGFDQAFDTARERTANVVGYIAGTDSTDVILIGAHHDHLGAHHPGANDNASGIVALLAIAQAIRQQPKAPPRTIAFVAFGAEEQGMVGSKFFAAHAPAALPTDHIVYDINLDMVGSYASRGAVYVMGTFPKLAARKLLDGIAKAHRRLDMGLGGRGERSDHEPFCALGIPYVFFWTPDDRCYHAPCDTAANVDVRHLAEIAKIATELVSGLANSDVDLAAARSSLGCSGVVARRGATAGTPRD
ncbi:MAG: peptidase [Myxococcales bacterium]|nr:peptidase [Myxococcales bacterium]